jgi:hypothetical protein
MPHSYDAIYRALVTSTADPTGMGKIKVVCPQVSGQAEIRSAEPVNSALPVPTTGTTVWIMFSGGDLTKPAYFSNTAAQVLIKDWTAFTLASGFTSNGNNNGIPQYQVITEFGAVKVNLRGGIAITYPSSTIANGGVWVNSLPALITPVTYMRSLPAACSASSSTVNSVKANFNTDGTAFFAGTNTTTNQPPWASLNALSYYV